MAMNETIRETIRKELAASMGGWGFVIGMLCFSALCFLVVVMPGLAAFVKLHEWAVWIIVIVSMAAGGIVGSLREERVRREIARMDDDTLKFRHDELSRKKQRSSFVFYIVVALVAAYFIFRD